MVPRTRPSPVPAPMEDMATLGTIRRRTEAYTLMSRVRIINITPVAAITRFAGLLGLRYHFMLMGNR